MTHNEIKQKLFALYDGPLTEKERVLIEVHLAACKDCRQAVGEWENISGALFTKPAFSEAEEDRVVANVLARIEVPGARWVPWKTDLKWFLPLMGSAVTAAWVFFFVLPATPDISQPPLTMSLLASAQAPAQPAPAPARKVVRAIKPLPPLAFNSFHPSIGTTPVRIVLPARTQSAPPVDPFVQAVVYSY